MKLLRLELTGFKSFAKKTVIEFVDGITAIVGPNGSGKSNIADAIRWVLGEQSAKALRGGRMEDVIFNGTEQRRPLAYCEVTLVFDNSDGKLATEYTEVSVTRRVYRTNDAEYLINSRACRLKDIHELFRDTGIGKDGYSIIGQGRVDDILSNKSNERREIFEEAAGVMRYRTRREEAERKLANTRDNLVRINDVLAELRERVGPLEQQSSAAKRFLELREELKRAELNLYLIQHERLNERIAAYNQTLEQLYIEQSDAEVRGAELSSQCRSAEESERAQNAIISELQNRLIALTSGIESEAGETRVIDERLQSLRRDRERLAASQADWQQASFELSTALVEREALFEQHKEHVCQLESAAEQMERELQAQTADIDRLQAQLDENKATLISSMSRMSDATSGIARTEAMIQTYNERLADAQAQIHAQEGECDTLREESREAFERLADLKRGREQIDRQRNALEKQRNACRNGLAELNSRISHCERELSAAQSRAKVLTEMKESHEGYYSSVRNIMRDAASDPRLSEAIEGVVAELIDVPQEYETAIEMALGSSLQNIVTKDESCAKYVIDQLRRKNYGRATFLPLSSMRSRNLSPAERSAIAVDGCFGAAIDLIGYESKYHNAIGNLLGRTVIVRDLDVGIAINKRVSGSLRVATLKGDIINQGGSITGGSVQKREFSLLGRERELAQLTDTVQTLMNTHASIKAERDNVDGQIATLDDKLVFIQVALHDADVEVAAQNEKSDTLEKLLHDAEAQLEKLQTDRLRLQDNIADAERRREESMRSRDSLERDREVTSADIAKMQRELYDMRQQLAVANERVTQKRVELATAQKELQSESNDIERIMREIASGIERGKEDKRTAETLDDAERALLEQLTSARAGVAHKREEANGISDEIKRVGDELERTQTHLDELREVCFGCQAEVDAIKERISRAQIQLNKAETDLEAAQERVWRDYAMTYEHIKPYRRSVTSSAEHLRIDELRKEIRQLGEVSVASIEEYRLVKERCDTLGAQVADLERAERDLQQLIEEIIANMRLEFSKQFAMIQANFAEVFSELFGGGRAELVLSDQSDILNCDIDIIAQPPGKKLQLLSLLSGGERALTAIALLFAILKLKPTAFCVLDEIEAALDEINVSNFAEYLLNYSRETQFILITHRKGSMAVCNALYGVAMEERGVSRIASARFDETA
ncbi:MAG: chromosome segregation protein SMC [Clostridia bacterium]|nr:chromosome segregation protein SMC [Clostridia bacterium]